MDNPRPLLLAALLLLPYALAQNCEPLATNLNLTWTTTDTSVTFQATATGVNRDGYIAIGTSGSPDAVQMVGGDAAIIWFDGDNNAVGRDFFLGAKAACESGNGVCRDNQVGGGEHVRNSVSGSFNAETGVATVQFTRLLDAVDDDVDADIALDAGAETVIIWAIGEQFDSERRRPLSHVGAGTRGGKPIALGRDAQDNCAAAPAATEPPVAATESPVVQPPVSQDCSVEFGGETLTYDSCQPLTFGMEMFWSFVGEDEIEVVFQKDEAADDYIGFSFSSGSQMVGNAAVIVYRDGDGGAVARDYFLGAKSSQGVSVENRQNLSLIEGSFRNGLLAGRFVRKLTVPGEPDFPVLSPGDTNALWAVGARTGSDVLNIHSQRAAGVIDLGAVGVEAPAPVASSLKASLVAHAVLMGLSWVVLVPSGVLIARYLKGAGPIWFQLHRAINSLGVLMFFIAWIIGLAEGSRTSKTHLSLGSIAVILGVLQVVNALLRPHAPDAGGPTKQRFIWFLIHSNAGRLAIILAIANVFVGLNLPAVSAGSGAFIAVGVFVGLLAIFICCAELYRFLKARNGGKTTGSSGAGIASAA